MQVTTCNNRRVKPVLGFELFGASAKPKRSLLSVAWFSCFWGRNTPILQWKQSFSGHFKRHVSPKHPGNRSGEGQVLSQNLTPRRRCVHGHPQTRDLPKAVLTATAAQRSAALPWLSAGSLRPSGKSVLAAEGFCHSTVTPFAQRSSVSCCGLLSSVIFNVLALIF